jgi:flagellar biosynthesis GTPase FlhF
MFKSQNTGDDSEDESEDESEYEYVSSSDDEEETYSYSWYEKLTDTQKLNLALCDSQQEKNLRMKAEEERRRDKERKEREEIEKREKKREQKREKKREEAIRQQEDEKDPIRKQKVYDDFVELVLRESYRIQTIPDYVIWTSFSRLIIYYDYSLFLDSVIPSISSFWKLRKYKFDIDYGSHVVKPKIAKNILILRNNLIKFMKENYITADTEIDLGVWSEVCSCAACRTSIFYVKTDRKLYEEKWNSLFNEKDIREHFKNEIINELLLFIGTLYNFYKYNNDRSICSYRL